MKRILLAALVGTTSAAGLVAQTAGEVIIDRVQQPSAPAAPGAAAPAKNTGEQGDLDGGTQRIAEPRTLPFKLTFSYDVQAIYVTNVFLSSRIETSSVILANTLITSAEFDSIPVGEALLTPSVGLVYQRYNHGLFTNDQQRQDLDFDTYTLPFNLLLRCGDNWEFSLGVAGTAVYSLEPTYDLTYKSISTSLSARKTFTFGQNKILTTGASVNFVKTDAEVLPGLYRADRNDKIDTSFDVGYYYLKNNWVFGSFSRLTYTDYLHYQEAVFTDYDRRDLSFSIGVSATYNINKWASARAFTSTDWRHALGDDPFNSYGYKNTNLGVGLSLTASF